MKYILYRDDKYISEANNKQSLLDTYENDILNDNGNWTITKTSNRSNNILKEFIINIDKGQINTKKRKYYF